MSEALKLIEDMISFDFSQEQNKKPGSGVILRYSVVIHRKFFSEMVLFVQILLQTPECSSGTSQYQRRVYQLQVQQKDLSSYNFRAFKSRSSLKR
jgi:hypothetical protein